METTLSTKTERICNEINSEGIKLGDLRNIAKEIKKDHELAKALWDKEKLNPRLLSILIMDKKELTIDAIDHFISGMQQHPYEERLQLADWLLANQLSKDKKTIALLESWEKSDAAIKRRLFWYHQGRLRWVGQKPPENTTALLAAIEEKMLKEAPEVQWAMNFTAAWIGIFDTKYREQCIKIGEKTGLYKDEMVARNCTPNYLPEFIAIEVAKRNKG